MSRVTTKVTIARQDGTVLGSYVLGLGEHVIGRDPDAAICIEIDSISRQHAKLILSAGVTELEDMGSTSGTFVDGAAVRGRIPLAPGQTVYLSNLYLDIERSVIGELVVGGRMADGRFTLIEKLGQGGMGAVWKAMDRETGQPVALKLLPSEMGADSAGLRDLEREVAKTKALQHPNIVQVGGLWRPAGEPAFVTLEYVEGADLHKVRDETPHGLLPWSAVQHYMLQLCDALEYAHQKRVAHRDLKPGNLLIDKQGNLKLADFGISASISNTVGTSTISVLGMGTPPFMGPQQIEGRPPQASDDIYSLGATFYDLLTSNPPFYQGDIVHQVLNVPPTPIEARLKELGLENDVPEHVRAIIMACLQKNPAHRPSSAQAVRQWIENQDASSGMASSQEVWEEKPSVSQHPESRSVKTILVSPPHVTRRKKVVWSVAAAVLVLVGIVTFILLKSLLPTKIGNNQSSTVKIGTPIWGFQPGGYLSSPAIGSDGTVYVGSYDKKLYAINGQSGVKLWEFETGAEVISSPAIGSDGTVYVGSYGKKLYAINGKSGVKLWEFQMGGPVGSPAIGSDGTVYVGSTDNKLYAINGKNGVKLWEFKTGGPLFPSPAIGSDGTVYVGADTKLYAINGKSGVKLWEFQTRLGVQSSPAIGSDGTVYVGADTKLYAINGKSGVKLWEFKTGSGVGSSPAIGSDGTVYVGSMDKKLYAINGKSGVKLWEFETGSGVYSSPAIGSDGTVYVGSIDKKLYAINGKSGVKLWEFQTRLGVQSSPAIGSDGTVYFVALVMLYAIKTDSLGLAKSPWPMLGQNPLHTGRVMEK